MALPQVKLDQGIHVMHLFYSVDRQLWESLPEGASAEAQAKLQALCEANANASHPCIRTYANVGGKADLAFFILGEELGMVAQLHRDIEACFPGGALVPVYNYLSVTELSEYMPTEEDSKRRVMGEFRLEPGTPEFDAKMEELAGMRKDYERYRLYPEMPDWEVMCFYPMLKRRDGADNWYSLDFDARKKLMAGHARVGRTYADRIKQLITGSTGLDDWEWGVTLIAHQTDAVKEIVYEMRFDEVSARYGGFGEFYINLRLQPADLWEHLRL